MTLGKRTAAVGMVVVAIGAIILVSVIGDAPGEGSDTTSTTTTDASATSGTSRSALDEFFGRPSGPDVVEVSRLRAIQEAVVRCMDERGFDYRPQRITVRTETEPDLEEVRRVGFGISTGWTPEGVAPLPSTTTPPTTTPSPEYGVALRGGYLGDGHMADETGCRNWARSTVSDRFAPVLQAWSGLEPALAEMEQAIDSDDTVVEAKEEWAQCMVDAGFDYERPNQVFTEGVTEIQSMVEEITGGEAVNTNPFAGWSQAEIDAFYRENSADEVERYIDEVTSVSAPEVDPAELAPIQEQEIALAVANAECGPIVDRAKEAVQFDYEADLIERNRSDLVEIRRQIGELDPG